MGIKQLFEERLGLLLMRDAVSDLRDEGVFQSDNIKIKTANSTFIKKLPILIQINTENIFDEYANLTDDEKKQLCESIYEEIGEMDDEISRINEIQFDSEVEKSGRAKALAIAANMHEDLLSSFESLNQTPHK